MRAFFSTDSKVRSFAPKLGFMVHDSNELASKDTPLLESRRAPHNFWALGKKSLIGL